MRNRFRVPEMEGWAARWYARQRSSAAQLETFRQQADLWTIGLPKASDVLEVAPGPGFLAIEMARLGHRVSGLDISQTMVKIANENAQKARVEVNFVHGDAARLPFEPGSFDRIVCQAAFKNFKAPDDVLAEMHRVLRAAGSAVIEDLNKDAPKAAIDDEAEKSSSSRVGLLVTRWMLTQMLRRRAHTRSELKRFAADSPFAFCDVFDQKISVILWLTK